MNRKHAAALLGVVGGACLMVFVELMDLWLSDGGFFDTVWSWLLLALCVVIFPFLMVDAYQNRRGIYADRDELTDELREGRDQN